jgi:hypothetical protein
MMVEFMGSIFGRSLEANRHLYSSSLSAFLGERISESIEVRRSDQLNQITATERPLSSILGLEIRPAEHYDADVPLFSYSPQDLEEFKKIDSLMFEGLDAGGFMEHMQVSMDLAFRLSRTEFIHTHALYKTIFELFDLMKFSSNQRCPIYAPGYLDTRPTAPSTSSTPILQDRTALYKLFVAERGFVPNLSKIDDVLHLREDKRLAPLRDTLRTWENEIRGSDVSAIQVVRKDVAKAQRELKKFGALAKAGQYISYASLPIGVADLFMQTPFSLVAGAVGSAMDIRARVGLERMSWFNFGT